MREVDEALARAYGPASKRVGWFRKPHTVPGPHFQVESEPISAAAAPVLVWPETVRTLERQHGDRFDALAGTLVQARDLQHSKLFLFTSCHRAEGRTTLVLTLARALARKPGRTLLVDADLSGPMLARQLGLVPRVGLNDVIASGLSLDEAIIDAPDDHLFVLPLRSAVSRPRDFLASDAWSRLLGRLRHDFDLVLFDGGPLFTGLSSARVPRGVDAAVLVHHSGLTGDRAMLRARESLDAAGVPLLGLAQTFC